MSATYMSRVPSLSELNAILDPSGDHRGSLASSATSECVVCVISEPSAFIIYIYISRIQNLLWTRTRFVAHRATMSDPQLSSLDRLVRFKMFEPSASMT